MEHRHIFLTGEKQVGKSTIWQTLLEGRPHTGFITEPFFVQDVKRGYILHSILDLPDMMNDVPCVVRVNERRQTAVPSVFEGAGVKALEKGVNIIGVTRGEVTKIHHTEKLDQGEVLIAQFTDNTSAMKIRGNAEVYTQFGVIRAGDIEIEKK